MQRKRKHARFLCAEGNCNRHHFYRRSKRWLKVKNKEAPTVSSARFPYNIMTAGVLGHKDSGIHVKVKSQLPTLKSLGKDYSNTRRRGEFFFKSQAKKRGEHCINGYLWKRYTEWLVGYQELEEDREYIERQIDWQLTINWQAASNQTASSQCWRTGPLIHHLITIQSKMEVF